MKKIILLIIFTFSFSTLFSQTQWSLTNGPQAGRISSVKADSNILYSAAWGAGVFRSIDNGTSWTNQSSGLPNLFTTSFCIDKGRIYVGLQYRPLSLSIDSGNTWTPLGIGSSYSNLSSISANDSLIVLITDNDSVRLSKDYGVTWKKINYQFTSNNLLYPVVKDSFVFASVSGAGVYRLGLNDTAWVAFNNGLSNLNTKDIRVCGNRLYVSTGAGLFYSTNNGNSWAAVSNGISSNAIKAMDINGSYLVAEDSTKEVFLSVDSGITWSTLGIYPLDLTYDITTNGSSVLSGTYRNGVMRTINNGLTWTEANNGLTASEVWDMTTSGTNLYAQVSNRRIFKSPDNGNSWTEINPGWPYNSYIDGFAVDGNKIYVAAGGAGIYISLNGGTTWSFATSGLSTVSVRKIALNGLTIYAGTSSKGIYKSVNGGVSWSAANTGISTKNVTAICVHGNDVYAGTSSGLFKSSNGGSTWANLDSGISATADIDQILSSGNYVYVLDGGVNFSSDNGISWNGVSTLPNVYCIGISGNYVYHGTFYHGISATPLGQQFNYTVVNSGLTNPDVFCISSIGNLIFAGTYGGAVYVAQALSTSLEEEGNLSSELKLYPNPATEEISIEWLNHDISNVEIQITNSMGQKVNTSQLNKDMNQKLFVGNLPSGIYLISIRDKDEVVTRKFLKQ
ncbi:MAG: T9SS type A sorting domain-containing protein [Bacteroidetes bacterium]|nr:T9SS type A sorting domain-containing protein [Bacteroidota bacterium]